MGKKRHSDHQITENNLHHQNSDQNQNRGGGIKKRSSSSSAAPAASEESQLLHKLNTHFKKLSKTRSKLSPAAGKDAIAISAAATAMHASNGGSPCNSSTRALDINDDHHHNFDHISASASGSVVTFKFKNGKLLDNNSNCCSGESETSTTAVTTSFVVATEIQELFGGDFTFAPDFNAAHSLVHLEFVADGSGFGFGYGYGYGSSYLTDPIAFVDVGFGKYSTTDMLKLSSQEEMIQEFLKNNLFD